MEGSTKKKTVALSDAAPLIQLALSRHLELLPKLYDVAVPKEVFEETQHYRELADAIEIAKAAGKWLVVKVVKNRKQVNRLIEQERLGEGEAEALVLCKEIHADSLLTGDKFAATKAAKMGLKTITVGDVIKEAYNAKIMKAAETVRLLDNLVNQSILNTSSFREPLQEAREEWP